MKLAVILVAVAGAAWAGAAAAQDQISDTAYLQANRCKGIATGLGADIAPFKAYLKNQARSRADLILFKASAEAGQAAREATDPTKKARLAAELSGPCRAYAPTSTPKALSHASAAP